MTESDDRAERDIASGRAPRTLLAYLERVHQAVAELPARYRLHVLELAWLASASEASSDALAIPGGHDAERDRQLAALDRLATRVRDRQPDVEFTRLLEEGDWDAAERYLEQKFGGKQ
jgi:hypothetical protein